jgi:hypothetical protein
MNHHKNAGLTFARRGEMVRTMIESKLSPAAAAAPRGVKRRPASGSPATGREARPRWPTPAPDPGPARGRFLRPKRGQSSSCGAAG